MCYALLLSTTSLLNLEKFNDESITFDQKMWDLNEEKFLGYKNQWIVLSKEGCSCGFRHVSEDLGFGLPEEWYPETEEEIEATKKLIEVIRMLIKSGEKVDCVNAWLDDELKKNNHIDQLNVDLNKVSNDEFRFHGFKRYIYV